MNYDVMCTIFCHPKAKLLVMNLNGMSTKDKGDIPQGDISGFRAFDQEINSNMTSSYNTTRAK